MEITALNVKALRDATGAGMMDAKKALTAAGGDMEAARQLLREKGLAKAASRAGRDSSQGAVAAAGDSTRAAVVLLNCETDFSAKSEAFVSLAQTLADAVLAEGPDAVGAHADAVENLRLSLRENIRVGAARRVTAAPGNLLDTYVHRQYGRGVNAVVVEGSGVPQEDLHGVALHIAFARPEFLSTEDIPPQEAERERAALLEITKAEGKPERAWGMIVEGRLRGWYKQRVLLEQGLHGGKTAVKNSIAGGSIVRFAQVVVGS